MANLVLVAPMQGWSAPLDEVPDEVFAARLLGDGVAIDPTGSALHAPCDGEIVTIPAQKHAVTLRAANGAEILLHVGVETVALGGEGFELLVREGTRVKAGDVLMRFDLDLLAKRAKSLLTPIIVTDAVPFSVARRAADRAVNVGDFLMELAPATPAGRASDPSKELGADDPVANAATRGAEERQGSAETTARVIVPFEHGIHARPAALITSRVKHLAATTTVSLRGRSANARSAIALMSLGARKGDELTISAVGPDAAAAVAALEAAIRTARDESPKASSPPSRAASPTDNRVSDRSNATAAELSVVRGVTAAPGLAAGRAFHLVRREIPVTEAGDGESVETAYLEAALAATRTRLQALASSERGPAREVIGAHLEFLDDPELIAAARNRLTQGKSAAYAWRQAVRVNVNALRALPDARMAERADDLLDLEGQLLATLRGESSSTYALPERAIVLANELLPSQFVALDASRLSGICTAGGGPTSHVAILASAMDVPMIVAAGAHIRDIPDGTELVLDADRGTLHIAPPLSEIAAAEAAVSRRRAHREAERRAAQGECRTADGTRIEVFANVGSVAEAHAAVAQGAEGCGLLRTEFLFLDRDSAPDEATQTAQYQGVVTAFAGRPVVIRTLDVGGDKPLTYVQLPVEENPALGVRGVRVSLQHPQLLRVQLAAILKVQPRGRCRILIPMVSDAAEVSAVREVLDAVRREVGYEASIALGAMIETPAAAMLADQIARVADFLSIGTNDLTQYTLAMDRGNPALAPQLDAANPAVLRLIAHTARAARAAGRDVAVCGGLASDPLAAPLLIGLGVNELSAVPAVLPRLKNLIHKVSAQACEELARRALDESSAGAVRRLISQWAQDHAILSH